MVKQAYKCEKPPTIVARACICIGLSISRPETSIHTVVTSKAQTFQYQTSIHFHNSRQQQRSHLRSLAIENSCSLELFKQQSQYLNSFLPFMMITQFQIYAKILGDVQNTVQQSSLQHHICALTANFTLRHSHLQHFILHLSSVLRFTELLC